MPPSSYLRVPALSRRVVAQAAWLKLPLRFYERVLHFSARVGVRYLLHIELYLIEELGVRPRREDRRWPVFKGGLWPRSGPKAVAVESVLIAWRHKAADILLVAVAVSYLPMVVPVTCG